MKTLLSLLLTFNRNVLMKNVLKHSRGIEISKVKSDWRPIIFSGSHFVWKEEENIIAKSIFAFIENNINNNFL